MYKLNVIQIGECMSKNDHLDARVCNWCGKPFNTQACRNHRVSFQGNRIDLPLYGSIKPFKTKFVKRKYNDWMDRMRVYSEFIYPEINETTKTIIDLGCGTNQFVKKIKEMYPQISAWGYDAYQRDSDIRVLNFEQNPLPFGNEEVDIILLSHILEHIENIHYVLDEAFRVGKKIIIVLPNTVGLFTLIKAASGQDLGSMYGLPLVRPKDRHKWVYTVTDAMKLIGWYSFKFNRKYNCINFIHRWIPLFLGSICPNLFSSECMFIISK